MKIGIFIALVFGTLIQICQPTSGSVLDLEGISSFPSIPLSISWREEMTTKEEVFQYFIFIFNHNRNQCVWKVTLSCIDCNNTASTAQSCTNIFTGGCSKNQSLTFGRHNSTFSVLINDSTTILPYVFYDISVIPLKVSGCGNSTKITIRTSQYKSGQVINLRSNSSFPLIPLLVSWEKPSNPNGEIIQYSIFILHHNQSDCLLKMSLYCFDCNDTVIKIPSEKNESTIECKSTDNSSFSRHNSTFSVFMDNSTIIQPYTRYDIFVVPINAYGRGDMINITVTTAQYISSKPININVKSSFPRDNLQISWDKPKKTNGDILEYLVSVYSENACIILNSLKCMDCDGEAGKQNCQDLTCRYSEETQYYLDRNMSYYLNITNSNILPRSSYKVSITPKNSYGCGTEGHMSIDTQEYYPEIVKNVTSTIKKSCITMSWQTLKDPISEYSYDLELHNSSYTYRSNVQINETSFAFPCVEFCSLYEMCIRTSISYGKGNWTCIYNTTDISMAVVDTIDGVVNETNVTLHYTYSGFSNCNITFQINCNGIVYQTSSGVTTISGLQYFQEYIIQVTPFTHMTGKTPVIGYGKNVTIMTETSTPGPVSNFECEPTSYNSITCSWGEPLLKNGIILNYNLICKSIDSIVFNQTISDLSVVISDNIFPDVLYFCDVKGFTSAGNGSVSSLRITITASPIPHIINGSSITETMNSASASKVPDSTTQIRIVLPFSHFTNNLGIIERFTVVIGHRALDMMNSTSPSSGIFGPPYIECASNITICSYEILVQYPDSKSGFKKRSIMVASTAKNMPITNSVSIWKNVPFLIGAKNDCSETSLHKCNGPLGSGAEYQIGFRVYTRSGFVTVGPIWRRTDSKSISIIFILIGLFVPLGVVLFGVCLYFYIRHKHKHRYTSETEILTENDILISSSLAIDHRSPMVHEFHTSYQFMQQDSGGRIMDDFHEIKDKSKQYEIQKPLIVTEGNDMKNRYNNIKPYKHNRIKLLCKNDYINASRVCPKHWDVDSEKQCDCKNIYIATQGPIGDTKETKTSTIGDFWRMVFENNVGVIVNLTKCEEDGKEKCSQYWPDNGSTSYISNGDHIEIELLNTSETSDFTTRLFIVSMKEKSKHVTQMHMTGWPDHGCPSFSAFLCFYTNYQNVRKKDQSVVVHCSAGVGRTGTFILIDEELSRISKPTDRIEIFNNLLKLRKCRCQMVQTESQYNFIYDTIHEYLIEKDILKVSKSGDDTDRKNICTQSYENPIFVEFE